MLSHRFARSQSIDSIAGQLMRGSIAPSENKHHKLPYSLPIPFNIGLLPMYHLGLLGIILVSVLIGRADRR